MTLGGRYSGADLKVVLNIYILELVIIQNFNVTCKNLMQTSSYTEIQFRN